MKQTQVLNFGSLNIDNVYQVPHFVQPGETLSCTSYSIFAGGKGLNQSVALARAGVTIAHAGKIGADGDFLIQTLQEAGADTRFILRGETPTGHACIQVDVKGQNSILLYPGANCALTPEEITTILEQQQPGTVLLLQNEINHIPLLIREAKKRGLQIAINPAPCGPEVLNYPLELVDTLFVNEIEGMQLAGIEGSPQEICRELTSRYHNAEIIMTLGAAGALYAKGKQQLMIEALPVKVVDTTSAGDTFTGYFLAARLRGYSAEKAMHIATKASSLAVSRPGAAVSIPTAHEIFG